MTDTEIGPCPDCGRLVTAPQCECGRRLVCSDGGVPSVTRIAIYNSEGTDSNISAVGVELPSGTVVVEWVPEWFTPPNRLDGYHQSIYDSIDDLNDVTEGRVFRSNGKYSTLDAPVDDQEGSIGV